MTKRSTTNFLSCCLIQTFRPSGRCILKIIHWIFLFIYLFIYLWPSGYYEKVIGLTPMRRSWSFSSYIPVCINDQWKIIFLMYSLGLKFTITFLLFRKPEISFLAVLLVKVQVRWLSVQLFPSQANQWHQYNFHQCIREQRSAVDCNVASIHKIWIW